MKTSLKTVFLLMVILLLAAWGRWISASHVFNARINKAQSIFFDEIVYITLGHNLLERRDYSTRVQYEKMTHLFSEVPKYLNDPLFKHPPLVPVLLALCMKIFHGKAWSAFLPGLVLGVAMLPAIFLLGRKCFRDKRVAWFAVILLAVSPTHWICCTKIMLEAPLAFFVLVAVAAQLGAIRRPTLLWVSAIAWVLSWWTKYTSIPIWALCQVFFLICYPRYLRNKGFWLAQILAAVLFLPWLIWRGSVDGLNFIFFWRNSTEEWQALARLLIRPELWAGLVACGVILWGLAVKRKVILPVLMRGSWVRGHAVLLAAISIISFLLVIVWNPAVIRFDTLPWFGQDKNLIAYGPFYTYFLRQFWFEPVTLLGMTLGLLMPSNRRALILKGLALGGSLLFTVWGNYQMRYFLIVIPFWELLSAAALFFFYDKIRIRSECVSVAFISFWIGWSLIRSAWLVWMIAIPNDLFYF